MLTRLHARHGTTALLATTMTAPMAEIEAALARLCAGHCAARPGAPARVLGVHLEGPYLNSRAPGRPARPISKARRSWGAALHALAPIRADAGAELPGHLALIGPLVEAGIRVQIGHSMPTTTTAARRWQAGAAGFTHLFNAMTPLHHRAPGLVGAALAHAQHAELIRTCCVHPGAMRAALRHPRPLLRDGRDRRRRHARGRVPARRPAGALCQGGVRLPDGTLAAAR